MYCSLSIVEVYSELLSAVKVSKIEEFIKIKHKKVKFAFVED